MAIIFYDGFEGYQNQGFTLPSAAEVDMGKYWYLSTLYPPNVASEHYGDAGYSAFVPGDRPWIFQTSASGLTLGTTECRVGFWVKGVNAFATTSLVEIVRLRSDVNAFTLIADDNGYLYLYYYDDPLWPAAKGNGTLLASFTTEVINTSTWAHLEFYVNFATGALSAKYNGVEVLTATSVTATTTYIEPVLGDYRYLTGISTPPWDFYIDHFYATDGDPLPTTQDILAVGVFATADHTAAASNPGLKGTLTIGGTLYQNSTKTQNGSSNGTTTNYANGIHWQWFTDPSDSAVWSQDKFDDIQYFGLCYGAATASGTMRVDNAFLTYLEYNSGQPLVKYYAPTVIDVIETIWTKSDASQTYAGHVDDIPRTNTQNLNNTDNLYCAEPGCIRFKFNPAIADPILLTTGITFAEEFRTDYHDWVRVVGGEGVNFESYFISGYGVYGEGNKQFQDNYITVNYENVTNGSAYIQGVWDYTVDPDTGRWSMKQQVYRSGFSSSEFKHAMRKLKIRGSGRALQLRVLSQEGKPFTINGWSLLVTGEQAV